MESGCIDPRFPDLGTSYREVSAQLHGTAALSPGSIIIVIQYSGSLRSSSILKLEAAHSSETLVPTYHTI